MTAVTTLPDPASHPGLRLMEATAAALRGARRPERADDLLGGAFGCAGPGDAKVSRQALRQLAPIVDLQVPLEHRAADEGERETDEVAAIDRQHGGDRGVDPARLHPGPMQPHDVAGSPAAMRRSQQR